MLKSDIIINLKHKNKSDSGVFSKSDMMTFSEILSLCDKFIEKNSKQSDALANASSARDSSERLINAFVNKLTTPVEGYTDGTGIDRLRKDLIDEILNYKVISGILEDPSVGEIRINSHKTIYYERHGKIFRLDGSFQSVDELQKVLEKLLGKDKALNRGSQFVNSRTPQGYRINATDKSISPLRHADGSIGDYTAVIRKIKKVEDKFTVHDIVKNKSLSDNMAKFMEILVKARFSFWTVGGTGSGKTVTNEIFTTHIKPMDRTVYIENPCEITPAKELSRIYFEATEDLIEEIKLKNYDNVNSYVVQTKNVSGRTKYYLSIYVHSLKANELKDELLEDFEDLHSVLQLEKDTGIYLNDFIQMEANSDKDNPKPTDPTPNNLIENALRQTPVWIIMGETRSDLEFKALLKAAQTGHKVVTTFHAENPEDAVRRYLMAYMAEAGNVPAELVLKMICEAFKFIVNVEKLMDGSRKVMYITEILGSKGLEPTLQDIYIYELEKVDDNGVIIGKHKRVGKVSPNTVYQFRKMGIPDSQFKLFTEEVSEYEEESYHG